MVEVMTQGLAPTADSWYPPTSGVRKELEPAIPQFLYDPARARQLLAEDGWTPGSDGVLAHQASGDRLEVEIWANAGFGAEKEMSVVADGWKAVGAQPVYSIIPAARLGDREYESTHPGVLITNPSGSVFEENRLHSREITSPANRWTGKNRGGYINARVDDILDKLLVTIDPKTRLSLQGQLLREQMGDVALAPLYWEVLPILMVQGVTGPKQVRNEATGNIFDWDKS
jgi:peptide/nickel transport system substrate-binding protein